MVQQASSLVEFKRDDPHMEERERLQASKKAAVERGEEIPVKVRKQSVKVGSEGCSARVGCALNDLYNLERITRTGRCNYYQDFEHKANTVRVGVWCTKCEVGMHRECYYSYHQVRYGVYLDNRYEINKSRMKQGMRKLVSSKAANFHVVHCRAGHTFVRRRSPKPWVSGGQTTWKLGTFRQLTVQRG